MVELMPNSGVYVYPRDLRIVTKKLNGSTIVRFLLSVLYTNAELVEAENVYGANEKRGLDKQVVKAIIGKIFSYIILSGT
jgi:hypothetical protein